MESRIHAVKGRRHHGQVKEGYMHQPPLMPWNEVHSPMPLFFLAPVFVFLASVTKAAAQRAFLISALTIILLAVASTYAAFEAGQALLPARFGREK